MKLPPTVGELIDRSAGIPAAADVSRETLAGALEELAARLERLEADAAAARLAADAAAADLVAVRQVTDTLAVLLREMAPALDAMAAGGGPFAVLGAMRR